MFFAPLIFAASAATEMVIETVQNRRIGKMGTTKDYGFVLIALSQGANLFCSLRNLRSAKLILSAAGTEFNAVQRAYRRQ
jgi:hypothetical protein